MKKIINVIAIIMIIVALSLIGYATYLHFFSNNKESEVIEKDNKKTDKSNEVLLNDENIKKDLLTKFYTITGSSESGIKGSYTFRYDGVFGNVFDDFNDDLKLRVILDYFYNNELFDPLTAENYSEPIFANFHDGIFYQLPVDKVVNLYKLYFGTDPVLKSLDDPKIGCFGYTYSPEKQLFFKIRPTCGGETSKSIYSYVNRFVVDGDKIYLYANFGSNKYMGTGADSKLNIYTDLASKEVYKKYVDYKDANKYRINESNYEDFSEYCFTFQKDDADNYYFVTIKRV